MFGHIKLDLGLWLHKEARRRLGASSSAVARAMARPGKAAQALGELTNPFEGISVGRSDRSWLAWTKAMQWGGGAHAETVACLLQG